MPSPSAIVSIALIAFSLPALAQGRGGGRGNRGGEAAGENRNDATPDSELVMLKGDEGARRLLARYPTAAVELDDPGVLFDIDTVDDLAVAQRRIDGLPTIAR